MARPRLSEELWHRRALLVLVPGVLTGAYVVLLADHGIGPRAIAAVFAQIAVFTVCVAFAVSAAATWLPAPLAALAERSRAALVLIQLGSLVAAMAAGVEVGLALFRAVGFPAGVLPGRTPLIGRLGYGALRTRTGEAARVYFVDGGFAQVRDDVVTVLTNRAVPARELDEATAAAELQQARNLTATTDAQQADKDRALARARAQLRLVVRSG